MAAKRATRLKRRGRGFVLIPPKGRPESSALDLSGLKMLLAALLVLIALTSGTGPARAAGAVGIVVRHSDGRILYAYVPLTSGQITGAEALLKSGLALNVAVGGSFGTAVCSIDGEGCASPREDCFCKSYGSPSFYWHYYLRGPDGAWRNSSLGAGNRVLHDGDVDGWSWTDSESGLPTVTLAQIASAVQSTSATPIPSPDATDAPTTAPTQIPAIATATADTQPRVAAIAPSGSATPVSAATKPPGASKSRSIVGFVAVAAIMLVMLAFVPVRTRRRGK